MMNIHAVHLDRLTEARTDDIAEALCHAHDAVIVRKADSKLMGTVTSLLRVVDGVRDAARILGVDLAALDTLPTAKEWLTYGTTLGHMVFTPDGMTPYQRIRLLTHEFTHVDEAAHRGSFQLAVDYVFSTAERTKLECASYSAERQVARAFEPKGAIFEPVPQILRIAHGYGLPEKAIQFGNLLTEQDITGLASGLVSQPVALEVLHLLIERGVLEGDVT